jgi:thiol-disulfide isomerase/thioredoxin
MRFKIICLFLMLAAAALAIDIPRKSPEFVIQTTDGKQLLVSQYRGKVLCLVFMLTTCPHCQKTTQVLTGIEKDLKPKGFEVVEGAVNENPDIPGFMQRFNPSFPVGTAPGQAALDYMQWPKGQRPLVPFMVFIDRQGMIRAQYSGLDEKFFDDNQEQHIRDEAMKLLNEAPPKTASKRAAK